MLPIILHIFNNMIAYTLQELTYAGKPLMEYIGKEDYYLTLYIVAASLVLLFIVFMVRRFYKEYKLTKRRAAGEV